jgi:hypothetical protein
VSLAFSGPTFNEFTLRLPRRATEVVDALVDKGIYAGVSARGPGLYGTPPEGMTAVDDKLLVVAVTELHHRTAIDRFAAALTEMCR